MMNHRESINEASEKVREQFQGFSRSTRILVIVGAIGLFALVILEAWSVADRWNEEADALVVQINRAKNAKSDIRAPFRNQVQSLGDMRLPDPAVSPFEAETRLFEAITEILYDNDAEMIQIDLLPSANLPSSAAPEIPRGAGQKLGKIVLRAEFDCPQDQVGTILRTIENNPEVFSVSRLQLNRFKDGQEQVRRLIDVDITVESWVLKTNVSRSNG